MRSARSSAKAKAYSICLKAQKQQMTVLHEHEDNTDACNGGGDDDVDDEA